MLLLLAAAGWAVATLAGRASPGAGLLAQGGGRASAKLPAGLPGARASALGPGSPRRLGPSDPRALVRFSLALRLPGRSRLARALASVNDPRSSQYGHFIAARTFGERYGLSAGALRMATRSLRRAGVTIVRAFPQRTALEAQAPVAVVDRLFGVQLTDFRDQRGRGYHAPAGTVVLPAALKSVVSAVEGLNTKLPMESSALLVPAGGLTPAGARQVYDLAPLQKMGIQGQGQRLAVISIGNGTSQMTGTVTPSDLLAYDQRYGLPPTLPQSVPVNGGTARGAPDGEVNLDLELTHAIAPRAKILDYNLTQQGDVLIAPLISAIAAAHSADVVSVSYGECELAYQSPAELQSDENAIEAAVRSGISVFVASGDNGAYQCQQSNPTDQHLAVAWPTASPAVTSVGGTSLSVGQSGEYLSETPWEGSLEQIGGGGGLSRVFARPPWQAGPPGVRNQFSTGARQVPDVSADADTATGWSVAVGGQLTEVGGTSAAAPFWAASMLLIRQYAQQHGHTAPGGLLNPMLYQIASTPQPVPPFHDITKGTNRYYPATQGWDFATGLGSPDVYNLAQDVASYLGKNGH